jgi:hypothetical protein
MLALVVKDFRFVIQNQNPNVASGCLKIAGRVVRFEALGYVGEAVLYVGANAIGDLAPVIGVSAVVAKSDILDHSPALSIISASVLA